MGSLDIAVNLLSSGMTGGVAAALFNPLDCLKVRWQVTPPGTAASMRAFAAQVVRSEGLWRGLWAPGLSANFWAVFVSSLGRVGLYPSVRDALVALRGGRKTGLDMLLGGAVAGGLGYWLSTPIFQLKTRLQAEAGALDAASGVLLTGQRKGLPPSYPSWLAGARAIAREGGARALLRGAGPLVARGAALSAGMQLGYDGLKTAVKNDDRLRTLAAGAGAGVADGPLLHGAAAVSGAFWGTLFSTPCDVVMVRWVAAANVGERFESTAHCARHILETEGPRGFMRGFGPQFVRFIPVFLISMPLHEQIRRVMGLGYLT